MEIVYEPHPVSAERKSELRAKGLKIVDARFAPESAKAEPVEEKPRRGRPPKAEQEGEE